MRRYRVVLTPPSQSSTSGSTTTVTGHKSVTYQSIDQQGNHLAGALDVSFDLPVAPFGSVMAGGVIEIPGVSLQTISSAARYQGWTATIYGGMQQGLPLANPKQFGFLARGQVQQAFGNWIGTQQSLVLVLYPAPEMPRTDGIHNIVMDWKKGDSLSSAIMATLQRAVPTAKIQNKITKDVVLPFHEAGYYASLEQFSDVVHGISIDANKTPGYPGIRIAYTRGIFTLYDAPTSTAVTAIVTTDLLGQPTWLGPNDSGSVIQLQVVLRGDLDIGNQISLPSETTQGYGILSPASSAPLPKDRTAFSGTFIINNLRHIGHFRDGNGSAWSTVIGAYPKGTSGT